MDGNGRWATARGLPREEGHRAGVAAVRRIVEVVPRLGVDLLTLYAFSSDNWRRPQAEVDHLMRLLLEFLETDLPECIERGARIRVIGSRARLGETLRAAIATAESATAGGRDMEVRIALDYSSRDAILAAAQRAATSNTLTREDFARRLSGDGSAELPESRDVDLLIRTGGESRLSDFLLWECAYAELYFTDTPWPDFDETHFAAAIRTFYTRQRRFGGLPAYPSQVRSAQTRQYAEYWLR
jgi:undecaprenyl diphosphate synthase